MRPSRPARSGTRKAMAPALHRRDARARLRVASLVLADGGDAPARHRRSGGRSRWHRRPRSPARRCGRRPPAPPISLRRVGRLDQRVYRQTARSRRRDGAPAPAAPPARHRPVPACVACSKISMPWRHAPPPPAPPPCPAPPPAASWLAPAAWAIGQHVRQHRAAADAMQHLGPARAHAHALAGGKDDDQKRVFGHRRASRSSTYLGSQGSVAEPRSAD